MNNRKSSKELIGMALYGRYPEELRPERSKNGDNVSPTEKMFLQSSTPNRSLISAMKREELSSPPFHPAEFDQPMISSQADKFHSHFIKLRSPNKKGQTRYRCVTCSHEFECTGKLRLIQHILGSAYTGNQSKNVRSCPLPYEPLKQALLRSHGQPLSSLNKPEPEPEPEAPRSETTETPAAVQIPPIKIENLPPPPSMSLEEGTTAEDNSRSDHDICEFLNGIGAAELDFLSTDLTDEDIFRSDSSVIKSTRSDDGEMEVSTNNPQYSQSNNNTNMYSSANKAVVQFFSNYRLPVTAVEDPLFLELLSAIRVAGPSYRPSMISLLQDTQILDKKSTESSPRSSNHSQVHHIEGSSPFSRQPQPLQYGNLFSLSAPNLRVNTSMNMSRNEHPSNSGPSPESFQFREPQYRRSEFESRGNSNYQHYTPRSSNTMTFKEESAQKLSQSLNNSPDRFQNISMGHSQSHNYLCTPSDSHNQPPTKHLKQTQSLPSMPSQNNFSFL